MVQQPAELFVLPELAAAVIPLTFNAVATKPSRRSSSGLATEPSSRFPVFHSTKPARRFRSVENWKTV